MANTAIVSQTHSVPDIVRTGMQGAMGIRSRPGKDAVHPSSRIRLVYAPMGNLLQETAWWGMHRCKRTCVCCERTIMLGPTSAFHKTSWLYSASSETVDLLGGGSMNSDNCDIFSATVSTWCGIVRGPCLTYVYYGSAVDQVLYSYCIPPPAV